MNPEFFQELIAPPTETRGLFHDISFDLGPHASCWTMSFWGMEIFEDLACKKLLSFHSNRYRAQKKTKPVDRYLIDSFLPCVFSYVFTVFLFYKHPFWKNTVSQPVITSTSSAQKLVGHQYLGPIA